MYCNYLLRYKNIKAYTPGMPRRRVGVSAGVSVVLWSPSLLPSLLLLLRSPLLCCCHRRRSCRHQAAAAAAVPSRGGRCCCHAIEPPLLPCHRVVVTVPLHRRCCGIRICSDSRVKRGLLLHVNARHDAAGNGRWKGKGATDQRGDAIGCNGVE